MRLVGYGVFYLQKLLEVLLGNLILHEIKVEKVFRKRRCVGLIIGVVVGFEVWVSKTLLNGHTVVGTDWETIPCQLLVGDETGEKVTHKSRSSSKSRWQQDWP
jgi:hypothetical protein